MSEQLIRTAAELATAHHKGEIASNPMLKVEQDTEPGLPTGR